MIFVRISTNKPLREAFGLNLLSLILARTSSSSRNGAARESLEYVSTALSVGSMWYPKKRRVVRDKPAFAHQLKQVVLSECAPMFSSSLCPYPRSIKTARKLLENSEVV